MVLMEKKHAQNEKKGKNLFCLLSETIHSHLSPFGKGSISQLIQQEEGELLRGAEGSEADERQKVSEMSEVRGRLS